MTWTLLRSVSAQNQSQENGHFAQQIGNEKSVVTSASYLWEESKVLHNAGTFLVENPHSQKRHTGTQILEGQVETSAFGERPETPDFCVYLH